MKLGPAYIDECDRKAWAQIASFRDGEDTPEGTQILRSGVWRHCSSATLMFGNFYRVPARNGEPVYQAQTFPELVRAELAKARAKHPAKLNSRHEAYAVILEELDELWFEIKADSAPKRLADELVQVAAMCQRMAEDVL